MEEPIVSITSFRILLNNLNFPNELHIWVDPNPKHGAVVKTVAEDTLSFLRIVLKLKLIHFKLAVLSLSLLIKPSVMVFLSILCRSRKFSF